MSVQYEAHTYRDKQFPIIFHTDLFGHTPSSDKQPPGKRVVVVDQLHFHWHEAIEVLRFIEGEADVRINEETVSAKPGDIVVINANRLHMVTPRNGGTLYDCLIINREICLEWGIDLSEMSFVSSMRDETLFRLFEDISREYIERAQGYKRMVMAKCTELMILLMRRYREEQDTGAPSSMKKVNIVQKVIRYISKNFAGPITLDSISAELGYSRYYIAHVFAEFTGMSVMEYLLQLRISTAQKMLANDEYSILDVATACGYRNLSSFSVVFRKKAGCTPSQYRSGVSAKAAK